MVVQGNAAQRVLNHEVVDFIDTALQGLDQSTAAYDGFELHGNIHAFQFIEH